jgi:hypothetical protein
MDRRCYRAPSQASVPGPIPRHFPALAHNRHCLQRENWRSGHKRMHACMHATHGLPNARIPNSTRIHHVLLDEQRSSSWYGRQRETDSKKKPFTRVLRSLFWEMAEGGRGEVLVQQQQYDRLRGVKARMRDDGGAWFARALDAGYGARVRAAGARETISYFPLRSTMLLRHLMTVGGGSCCCRNSMERGRELRPFSKSTAKKKKPCVSETGHRHLLRFW